MLNIRSAAFWTLDFLKGGIIRKHLTDIQEKNSAYPSDNEQLKKLLDHAQKSVPYYKDKKTLKLQNLPIITKADIKNDYESFKSHIYKGEVTHSMSTSGSTGTPFIIQQDSNKRKRTIAELIYFNNIPGQQLGERYMYIKAFLETKSYLDRVKQNVIPIDILNIHSQKLEEIRSKLIKDKSIKSILAYASTYEQLAKYLYELGDTPEMFNLRCIFSSSAVLLPETKEMLTKTIGCPIIDRYSNQENGVLAQTRDTNSDFYINRANYYIELLKLNSNEVAAKGELGRIVVTDLYNFAMPMIRYDTGDLAISDDDNRYDLRTIRNIQGRRVDIIYDTKGNMLTPHTWGIHMRKYKELKQWQFIQEDKNKYKLKVNGGEGIYTKEDFDKTLRKILGNDANIDIQYVNEIPVLASGKFKNTVSNYKSNKC